MALIFSICMGVHTQILMFLLNNSEFVLEFWFFEKFCKCLQRTSKWLLVSELFVRKTFIYTVNDLFGTKLCYLLNLVLVKLNLIEISNQKRSFLISCVFFVLDVKIEVSLIPR